MSSNTLSSVLQKLIGRLCLEDFPCGYGSWRKTEGAESEETDALLDLLSCPHSPWQADVSWSPQASALRRLAVSTPKRLHTDFIYSYFTTLRIVNKGVSIIDKGLLKFSKLEELVLSANKISEIPADTLPRTLKILELCVNQVSSLNGLACSPPPCLQYLGLSSNRLGSGEDLCHLTGRQWPHLVCLDLSNCEFVDQWLVLNALNTLPCLRTLMLEGNPFTLASCYPGVTVDGLPRLSCLDGSWISSEERERYRGLTVMRDMVVDLASATVSVGRIKGIPNPMMSVDEYAPEFPIISYSYYISYHFISPQTADNQVISPFTQLTSNSESRSETEPETSKKENGSSDPSNKNCEKEKDSLKDAKDAPLQQEKTCSDEAQVFIHSTSKLRWSDCLSFSDTQTFTVKDLKSFKRFIKQGLHLTIQEEKILSWPAASEDVPSAKANTAVREKKGGKEKETQNKSASTKDKSKEKKKKSAQDLIHDSPITRVLASAHVPLQVLLKTGQEIDVLCEFDDLRMEPEDLGKKSKEQKKTEEKDSKQERGSRRQRNSAVSKGKEKGRRESEMDDHKEYPESVHQEPVTVELRVQLKKWQSASEAHQALISHQHS